MAASSANCRFANGIALRAFAPPTNCHVSRLGPLLNELREAVFDIGEAQVALAKSTWWAGEMLDFPQGQSRHPLGLAFAGIDAPWAAMARTWLALREVAPRPRDARDSIAGLLAAAEATIAVEAVLFAGRCEGAAPSLARHWLLHRLPAGIVQEDQARIQASHIARHAMTPERWLPVTARPHARLGERSGARPACRVGVASYFRRCSTVSTRRGLAACPQRTITHPPSFATPWLA